MMSKQFWNISEINLLSVGDFKLIFGNVIECCPEATDLVEQKRPFATIDDLKNSFYDYIDNLDNTGKEILVKKHPDLSGKMCKEEQLTDESRNEQKLAGINTMSKENKQQFNKLNREYEEKFGFPFVICARDNSVGSIITAIQSRLMNERASELHNAIEEVKKICTLRLNDIVSVQH